MPGGSGTALSGYANTVVGGGRTPLFIEAVTNGTDIKPGMVVVSDGETWPDVDPAIGDDADASASDAKIVGVVMEKRGLDIDTAFADGLGVKVALIGCGGIVWVRLKASVGAVIPGEKIYLADAEAGSCGVRQEPATPTVETNAINEKAWVGTCIDVSADVAGNRWIRVLLN